jgi:hypothetical protein
MEEANEKKANPEKSERSEQISKVVRAGKRTYFFDVKTTQRNDFYLTITESKKKYNRDGRFIYEKHLVYLYKEDFHAFLEGLTEMINCIRSMPHNEKVIPYHAKKVYQQEEALITGATVDDYEEAVVDNYTNVNFDDLEDKDKN